MMRRARVASHGVSDAFSRATAVTAREPVGDADHAVFDTEIHDGWDIMGNANGGYTLAIATRAMATMVGRDPLTVTAHYLSPGTPGAHRVEVSVVKTGKRLATATAALVNESTGREVIRVLGAFGSGDTDAPRIVNCAPPVMPAYEDCQQDRPLENQPIVAVADRLAMRLDPACCGFRDGEPTGDAEIRGWFAFADGADVDVFGLLLAADSFPPAVFNTDIGVGWVPTVEFTVHLRAAPAPGPLRCVLRSPYIAGGMLAEIGEVWDANDVLVAESRQLALQPRVS